MLNVLKNEPARVVAAIIALIGVATAFGLGITSGQQGAIVAALGAILSIIGGETVRANVVPAAKTTPPAPPAAN